MLISDGVYYEEVQVTTPSLTIRGTDRNAVVLDGQYQQSNGITVFATVSRSRTSRPATTR